MLLWERRRAQELVLTYEPWKFLQEKLFSWSFCHAIQHSVPRQSFHSRHWLPAAWFANTRRHMITSTIHSRIYSLPYFSCIPSKKKPFARAKKLKIITMSRNTPLPPSPDAPPPAATNAVVALSLIAPPSQSFPASPRCAGAGNLFRDASEKQVLVLVSTGTGYSPAKKKVGHRTRGASSSPRNAVILADDASSDNSNDEDYSPTLWLSALHSPRNAIPRSLLTVVFFYSFVRWYLTRRCLPAGILLFTPRRKWQNLTLVSKSNYCLISVLHVHLARSQH